MNNLKLYQILLIFFLFSTIFYIFYPMLNAEYATIDDHVMLSSYSGALKNLSFNYVINTFKNYHEGLYHPLVTLSYSIEISLFGFVPAVFHLNNILIHILNVFLVFVIFFNLSKSFFLTFIITFLFALHPTRAEVVCWISARKDLLYALFYLLSIFFYIRNYEKKKSYFIIFSVICYVFSCLSKSMSITLPCVLILIDIYKNNIDKKKIKIYLIYVFIAVIFAVITLNSHYEIESDRFCFDAFRQMVNFISAHFNILFYFDKLFLPINLYCMYPYFYDEFSSLPPWYIMYSPAILYILIFFSCLSLKKTKVFFFGLMFFLISIAPVSSVFPIGDFVVADRYTYIPYLGLFFIFAKVLIYFYESKKKYVKVFVILICLAVFCELSFLTYDRTLDWKMNEYGAPIKMKYYEFGIKKKISRKIITNKTEKGNKTEVWRTVIHSYSI